VAKRGVLAAMFTACLLGGVAVVDASAATGDLIQKSGAAGCISDTGVFPCVDGRALDDAVSVTVSPDGQNAYAASRDSSAIVVFDRAADGTLTQKAGTAGCISDGGSAGACVAGRAIGGAVSVTISPDGNNAYVASNFDDAVAIFDRAADGTLTQKGAQAGCWTKDGTGGDCNDGRGLDGAFSVTVSPGGNSVYVTGGNSDAVAVFDRAANGALTQKAGDAACISEDGTDDENGTPVVDACVDGEALDGARSVTVSPNGQSAYVASQNSNAVVVFDRAADGTLTQKAGAAGCISDTGASPCTDGRSLEGVDWVTLSPDGNSLYAASQTDYAVAVFDRAGDGTLTQKPGTAGCISEFDTGNGCVDGTGLINAFEVIVSPDSKSVYVASELSDAVALFDRAADGTLTQKAGTAGCISEDGTNGSESAIVCVDGTALDGAEGVTVSPDNKSVYVASASDGDAVTVFDRVSDGSGPQPPQPNPPLPPDTTKPLLSALSFSPARFRAAGSGPSISARVGTKVSYSLSEPAAVSFKVERALPGRRAGKRCVKPRRSNRRAKRCTRYVTQRGGFAHQGAAGKNSFTFRGRLRGRKLAPGKYRLRAVAADSAANKSLAERSSFRIVRR
jgi:DNA-binding beta-propeller fold protein YncE